MSKLNKETFYAIVKQIKKSEGKRLKVRIYKKRDFDKEYVKGYYRNWNLVVFTGEESEAVVDWRSNIQVLAHEYMHHLIERASDKEYAMNVDIANVLLYSTKNIPKEQREWAGKIVMLDEYTTDVLAFDILIKDWGLQEHYKKWWWYDANVYNLKIKLLANNGMMFVLNNEKTKIPVSKRRLSARQVVSKIPKSKKTKIDRLVKSKRLKLTLKNFKSV